MTLLVVLLALVVVGLAIWGLWMRETPAGPPGWGPPQRPPFPSRPPLSPTPSPTRSGNPRFQGRRLTRTPTRAAPTRTTPSPREATHRFVPGSSTTTPRFGGEVRRSPDAIGLACGRPIAECQRGADCLCVD